jgi:hypothetical protein
VSHALTACFSDWDTANVPERVLRLQTLFRSECNAFVDAASATFLVGFMGRVTAKRLSPRPTPAP